MTAPMTMNRVIHSAVRRDLRRLSAALGRFEAGDRPRARGLELAFDNLRRELTHHHESEDQLIWPMLAGVGVDGELLSAMESEHHAMADALAETSVAMSRLASSASVEDAAAARASVERTTEVVERHLQHEETEIEPQLLAHLESPEWKAVERKLSRQSPRIAGPFFAWVTDGMDDDDRTYLRSEVPAPVTFVMTRVFGRRYAREVAPVWRAT